MEIWTNATALGRHKTFVVTKFEFGGGDMKVSTINITSVNLHTPEHLCPVTDGDGGYRAAEDTKNSTGDITITDPVLVQDFEAPAPDPLND